MASKTGSTCQMETATGSHLFKIVGYTRTKGIGIGKEIRSQTFTVGGHDWALLYFPDGSHDSDNAKYISFFLKSVSIINNLRVDFDFKLLDQCGEPVPSTEVAFSHTFPNCGSDWGAREFLKRTELETSNYLIDDCFTVQCCITVINPPCIEKFKMSRIDVLPSDLHEHMGQLLETGEGADVRFEVNGETFAAHRYVLSARSPVFRALLLGSMKEKSLKSIKIKDMESIVFKTMLQFVYTDVLPPLDVFSENGGRETATMMAQHLLVAADRYGLERLRLVCEDRLCQAVDVNTVVDTLILADQHHCNQLKAFCLEFVASPDVLNCVIETDGFEHLMASCPSLVKDLLKKVVARSS